MKGSRPFGQVLEDLKRLWRNFAKSTLPKHLSVGEFHWKDLVDHVMDHLILWMLVEPVLDAFVGDVAVHLHPEEHLMVFMALLGLRLLTRRR